MASHRLSLANSWDQLAERPLIIARHHTTLQLRRNYGSLISLSNPTYHISETLEPHPQHKKYQPGHNLSSLIFHECRKSCLLTWICQQLLNHQLGSHLMSQLTFRAGSEMRLRNIWPRFECSRNTWGGREGAARGIPRNSLTDDLLSLSLKQPPLENHSYFGF